MVMGTVTMANLDSIHDKLCWTAFEDVKDAIAELRSVLPEALVQQLDWSSLRPLPERFVDEVMRDSHADRLYQVRCSGEGSGGNALVYVLQSSDGSSRCGVAETTGTHTKVRTTGGVCLQYR